MHTTKYKCSKICKMKRVMFQDWGTLYIFYNKTLQVSSITEGNGIGTYWRCFHWGFPVSINYRFKFNRWLSFTFTFHSSHQFFFFFGFSFLKTWSLRGCMKMNGLDCLYYDEGFTISENIAQSLYEYNEWIRSSI